MNARLKNTLAMAALVCALAAAPAMADTVETLIARSHAAEIAGKPDEAIILLQAAMVADSARASTYVLLGDFYARRNDPVSARKYYDEALFIDPALRATLEAGKKTGAAPPSASLDKH